MSILVWYGVNLFVKSEKFKEFRVNEVVLPDDARYSLWKDGFRIFLDYPIIGSGLETFGDIYGRYASINTTLYKAEHAHNEYVQQLSDCGLIGFSSLIFLLSVLGWDLFKTYKSRRSKHFIAIGGGAALGCLTFLFHSFFDFNFRIPSNLLLFSFMLSIAYLALKTKEREFGLIVDVKKREVSFKSCLGVVYTLLLLAIFIFLGIRCARDNYAVGLREKASLLSLEKSLRYLKKAVKLNGFDSLNYVALADLYSKNGDWDASLRNLELAKQLNKTNPYVDYEIFKVQRKKGDMDKAEKAIEGAINNDLMNAQWYKIDGDFYLGREKLVDAVLNYKKALELAPEFSERIFRNYFNYSGDILLARTMLPSDSMVLNFDLIKELVNRGSFEEAVDEFRKTIGVKKENEKFFLTMTDMMIAKTQYLYVKELLLENSDLFSNSQLYQNLGLALCKLGDIQKGVIYLQKSFETNIINKRSLDLIFEFLQGKDTLHLLKIILNRLSLKYRENGHINYINSKYYELIGEWYFAVNEAKIAVSKDTFNPQYRLNLGNLYFENGLYVDAISEWKKILELDKNALWVRRFIAGAYEKLGQKEEARKFFE